MRIKLEQDDQLSDLHVVLGQTYVMESKPLIERQIDIRPNVAANDRCYIRNQRQCRLYRNTFFKVTRCYQIHPPPVCSDFHLAVRCNSYKSVMVARTFPGKCTDDRTGLKQFAEHKPAGIINFIQRRSRLQRHFVCIPIDLLIIRVLA
ncbi:hypothetical protein CCX46_13025 [Pseudomonas sp. RU47]|nr:hypothetical protein CCX46_13025 [Pseudomonas sp. RU47]